MIAGAFLLILVAAAFVAAELFLPSHGVLGFCAVVAAGVAVYMAYQSSPLLGFAFGILVMAMTPVVFYWAIRIYPKTPLGKRIMLSGPEPKSAGFARESARLSELVGKRGVAMTLLRPAGSIEVDGRRIDAVSESEVIVPNTPVEVIRVNGLKVLVKAVESVK